MLYYVKVISISFSCGPAFAIFVKMLAGQNEAMVGHGASGLEGHYLDG